MTAGEKEYKQGWDSYIAALLALSVEDVNETAEQQAQRMQQLEAVPEKWFKYYFPMDDAEPAAFHIAATQRVLNNPEWYEVRLWSRELAKSTRTMMEVLYLTLVGHPPTCTPLEIKGQTPASHPFSKGRLLKSYTLLISSSLDNATRLLIPYKANLELNPRIINDYGVQQYHGKWAAAEFTTLKGASFRGVGASQPPRGAKNEKNIRPDVILFDDIDTDSDCRNPEMINKTWKWIEEAAIGTRSVSKATTIIFCGNRIAVDCCVVRACKYADYVDEVNIKDADGNPSWPQKNTRENIERVLKQKSYASAQKEYFNNPITEGAVFKQMNYKPMQPLNDYSLLVCYTDPSFKDGTKNDYKATVLVGKWHDEYHVIRCFVEQASTAAMIGWHYQIMDYINDTSHPGQTERAGAIIHADNKASKTPAHSISCYYYMEEVLLQELILAEFYKEGRARNRTIPIMGDQRKKGHKFTRIEALLEPLHRNCLLYLNEAEKNNPHMKRLEEQFLAFAPGSRGHDDAPDAVEGAVWIIANKETTAKAGAITVIKRKHNSKQF